MGFKFGMTIPETLKAVELNFKDFESPSPKVNQYITTEIKDVKLENTSVSYVADKNVDLLLNFSIDCIMVEDLNLVKYTIRNSPKNGVPMAAMRDGMITKLGKPTDFTEYNKDHLQYDWHYDVNGEQIQDTMESPSPCEKQFFEDEKCGYTISFAILGDSAKDLASFYEIEAIDYQDILKRAKMLNPVMEEKPAPSSVPIL
jgi:hypothetical protein